MNTYKGHQIRTLPSYVTPYFYAVRPDGAPCRAIGSLHHFASLRRLCNYIDRQIRQGSLQDLTSNPQPVTFQT